MDALLNTAHLQNLHGQSGLSQLKTTAQKLESLPPSERERIENTAKEFESVFVSQMLRHMWSGIETDPMFGGGKGEDMFRSMMIDEYGSQLAGENGIGIAKEVTRALVELQSQQFTPEVSKETDAAPQPETE